MVVLILGILDKSNEIKVQKRKVLTLELILISINRRMENKLWYIPTMVCYSTIRNKPLINAVIRMNESQKQYTL